MDRIKVHSTRQNCTSPCLIPPPPPPSPARRVVWLQLRHQETRTAEAKGAQCLVRPAMDKSCWSRSGGWRARRHTRRHLLLSGVTNFSTATSGLCCAGDALTRERGGGGCTDAREGRGWDGECWARVHP